MTEKDMGIFGFGKDQDLKIFAVIGVFLILLAAAYLYTNSYITEAEAVQLTYYSVLRRNALSIILATLLLGVIIYVTLALLKAWWPFNTVPSSMSDDEVFGRAIASKIGDSGNVDITALKNALEKAVTANSDIKNGSDVTAALEKLKPAASEGN